MAKRPILFDTELAEQTERDLEADDMLRATDDPNWIPGYSEYVRAEQLAKAEYGSMSYQQRAHQLRQLGVEELRGPPIHIKPLRVAALNGTVNDNVTLDLATYRAQGYRPLTVEILKQHGMKMPPLYTLAADGTLRRGDTALWFVDASKAKQIRDRKEAETRDREDVRGTQGYSTGVPIDVTVTKDPDFTL